MEIIIAFIASYLNITTSEAQVKWDNLDLSTKIIILNDAKDGVIGPGGETEDWVADM